mmetsp:Transcript_29834/g.75933  ORF Transcript_29834/g.75933 Transcript_29834/m.75933 type:complete len:224 (+) Transcript_29834:361-1032(+)
MVTGCASLRFTISIGGTLTVRLEGASFCTSERTPVNMTIFTSVMVIFPTLVSGPSLGPASSSCFLSVCSKSWMLEWRKPSFSHVTLMPLAVMDRMSTSFNLLRAVAAALISMTSSSSSISESALYGSTLRIFSSRRVTVVVEPTEISMSARSTFDPPRYSGPYCDTSPLIFAINDGLMYFHEAHPAPPTPTATVAAATNTMSAGGGRLAGGGAHCRRGRHCKP